MRFNVKSRAEEAVIQHSCSDALTASSPPSNISALPMPAVALAYGSFGDILSTAQLVIKIVQLLRRSGSPSGTWRETENELKALGSELAHLTLHQELEPLLAARIQQEVARCHLLMARFFAKINASQGFVQKILWAVSEEKELSAFRTQIIERRSALGVLVGLVNSGALEAVRARVEDVGSQVRVASESLSQQLATYQAQVVGVIAHVPHGISEQYFTVLSPTGVPIPISLLYCTSYQALDVILKAYLGGRKEAGSQYVKCGFYEIVSPDGAVIPPPRFEATIRNDLRLEICILKMSDSEYSGDCCPQCGIACRTDSVGWSQCQNPDCGATFKAVVVKPFDSLLKPPRDSKEQIELWIAELPVNTDSDLFRRIRVLTPQRLPVGLFSLTRSIEFRAACEKLLLQLAQADPVLWRRWLAGAFSILQKANPGFF
ncbi:hypothetical protein B0H16DRAFT_49867 [Mycena metata]|uniref:Ubiquitin-like domain-containing protein n=1 Tax=Mycena metata TaxID=1033252 RepID=A0AAD7IE53_9AGAR|nr:hypothetical protein B0H16DRAFT_49867 [Mycena metata]